MRGYVYILASRRNGTLYTGVTRDLSSRLFEHQNEILPGFTSRYGVKRLVWFEEHDLLIAAIQREKNIKKYPRKWKLNLIEAMNPEWEDISHYLDGCRSPRAVDTRRRWITGMNPVMRGEKGSMAPESLMLGLVPGIQQRRVGGA